MADMNSGSIARIGNFAQDTPPRKDPSVVWIDTSEDPSTPKIYDPATDAWIPVNTTGQVVQETKPDLEVGLVWFEPVSDGLNMYLGGRDYWDFLQFIPDIPDSAIHQYDASEVDGLSDGDTVLTWEDQIGSVYATDVGSPTFRTDVKNGLPAIELDGSDDRFDAAFSESQPLSIIAVAQANGSDDQYWFSSDSSGNHPFVSADADGVNVDAGSGVTASNSDFTGPFRILTVIFDGTDSLIRIDGSEIDAADYGNDGISSDIHIGARDDSGFLDGFVAEFVIYDEALDAETIDGEEDRVSTKWGITI